MTEKWFREKYKVDIPNGRVPDIEEVPEDAVGREIFDVIERGGLTKVQTMGRDGEICEIPCFFIRDGDHEVCGKCGSIRFNGDHLMVGESQ